MYGFRGIWSNLRYSISVMLKILLADDHTLFRDALLQYLDRAERDIKTTIAADFYEVSAILKKDPFFDLVLLDYRMPGMTEMEGLKILRREYPDLKIALMSGVAEPENVKAAMDCGAVGYFPKTLSGKALLQAIELVLTGQRFLPIGADSRIMPSYFAGGSGGARQEAAKKNMLRAKEGSFPRTSADIQLSPREKAVLEHLMRGAPNKEIARALGVQIVTVKLHVRSICKKLNVQNRTQIAIQARELGLLHDR
jgi:DNA-binding NarL/FixJ family response regulator